VYGTADMAPNYRKQCPSSLSPRPLLLPVTITFRLQEKNKCLMKSFKQKKKQGRQQNK